MVEFGNLEKLHPTVSRDVVTELFSRLVELKQPQPTQAGTMTQPVH